ncbi:MAG: Abi family protein [Weissella confusa]
MTKDKSYKTPHHLVRILRKRGLEVGDKAESRRLIETLGYFPVVTAYKHPFLLSKPGEEEILAPGTSLSDIYYIYEFDKQERNLVQRALNDIELHLRQVSIRHFVEKFGDSHDAYTDFKNYQQIPNNIAKRFMNRLKSPTETHNAPYSYFKEKYENVPLWVAVQSWDFGTLETFISYADSDVKRKIINEVIDSDFIRLVDNEDELTTIFMEGIGLMRKFRNRASHGYRIYNYRPQNVSTDKSGEIIRPMISYHPALLSHNLMTEKDYKDGYGQTGLGALFSILGLFEYREPFQNIVNGTLDNVTLLNYQVRNVDFFILDAMGYPPIGISRYINNIIERNKTLKKSGVKIPGIYKYFPVEVSNGMIIPNAPQYTGFVTPPK